ncbi:apolipoprotein E-like isoform X2 [Pomacea canaliculata]|uniref:apolipoprotein E-like isoform X2 n=1 Tax=Pomacea canaliculata TaxID=400727 RepID=UPI000D725C0F|nr:apolipoprotein E-like isoform X2 [Pomacea canaliculata]
MQPSECLLLLLLLFPSAFLKVSADTDGFPDVIDNSKHLESEVRRLKRAATNNRRNGGKKRVCESVSDKVARDITQELSGLRAQLHTSDVMTSLRAELQAGLASVRAEASDKAVVIRKELEAGLAGLRTELQKLRAELQAELNSDLNDVRSELQHTMTTSCSDQKEVAAALADLQSGLSAARSDVEQRVSSARAELEQRVSGVRSEARGRASWGQG